MVGQVEEDGVMLYKSKDEGETDENHGEEEHEEETASEAKPRVRRYLTKHMKLYPELYRSDVSIHPSYTTLKNLP